MSRVKLLRLMLLPMIIVIVGGCGQSTLRQGDEALQNSSYQQALAYYEQALQDKPNDPLALRALGRVYYHLKDYEQADKFLKEARSRLPKDGTTILYLGMLAEARSDFAGATEMYQKFLATNAKSKMAPQIKGRLLYVQNEKLRKQVAEEIKAENSLAKETPSDNTIGVLPFIVPQEADETLRSLAQGMAATLWYDLSTVKELQVVERLQLKYLTDELEVTEKGFSSKDSGPRLGKLVKAKHLIKASLDSPAEEKLSVQTGLINTGTSSYNPAYSADDDISKALRIQKEITLTILDSLGIKITGGERRALKKAPTGSYAAFLAFSRGIEQFDQGQYGKASEFFAQATKLDPSFDIARDYRDETRLLMTNSSDLGKFESGVQANVSAQTTQQQHNQADDLRNITTPPDDPRNQDPPIPSGTGTATVSGSVR